MKDFFIVDAAKFENASVTSYFVLSSFQVREKKQGGQFLAMTLTDKTGSFEARMWDDIADAIIWAATRPAHVNIAHVLMTSITQANSLMFHREQTGTTGSTR